MAYVIAIESHKVFDIHAARLTTWVAALLDILRQGVLEFLADTVRLKTMSGRPDRCES